VVGLHGCIRAHDLLARPSLQALRADAGPLAAIAVPAVIANVATPISSAVVTAAIARFGDLAIAGYAVIGRITPLAFGAIFALSGSIGPILGQNLGAQRFDRVHRAITDSLLFITAYCLVVWLVLALLQAPIIRLFGAAGDGAELIGFFCRAIAGTFVFVGALFVANAAYNNLGFPTLSTVFNWSRATLGTIPFVWIGASYFGADGVIAGQAAGSVVFGLASIIVCYRVIGRVARRDPTAATETPLVAQPIAPFNSGKAATAIHFFQADRDAAE
jgi:Na+-driven multidrug efflux pump